MIDHQGIMQELRETLPNTKKEVIGSIKETLESSYEIIQKAVDQKIISADYANEKMQTMEGLKELYQALGINPNLISGLLSEQIKAFTETEGKI